MGGPKPGVDSPGRNERILFWASFLTLIAAGIGFSIRGDILGDWGRQFGFTQTELGDITGMGLVGFGMAIIFFSFFADLLGYGKLMVVAFLLHVLPPCVLTLAATASLCPSGIGQDGAFTGASTSGSCFFSLGNGTCEAVINPLTATLFPRNKTHWLNILHAGWPGGLVLGALVGLVLRAGSRASAGRSSGASSWCPMLLYGVHDVRPPLPAVGGQPVRRVDWARCSRALRRPAPAVPVPAARPGRLRRTGHRQLDHQHHRRRCWTTRTWPCWPSSGRTCLMFTCASSPGRSFTRFRRSACCSSARSSARAAWCMLGQAARRQRLAVARRRDGLRHRQDVLLADDARRGLGALPEGRGAGLGISGGIGMISAGLLGGPGIGYKQDYAAVQELQDHDPTYAALRELQDQGEADRSRTTTSSPRGLVPDKKAFLRSRRQFPKVAGLDRHASDACSATRSNNGGGQKLRPRSRTTRQGRQARGNPALYNLKKWWETQGKPNEGRRLPGDRRGPPVRRQAGPDLDRLRPGDDGRGLPVPDPLLPGPRRLQGRGARRPRRRGREVHRRHRGPRRRIARSDNCGLVVHASRLWQRIESQSAQLQHPQLLESEDVMPGTRTFTFLGTGTSVGVPMLGCDCAVCRSTDPRNHRYRCAVLVAHAAGPHPDRHAAGTAAATAARAASASSTPCCSPTTTPTTCSAWTTCGRFPRHLGGPVPLYCTARGRGQDPRRRSPTPSARRREQLPAGYVPKLAFHRITTEPFTVLGERVTPIPLHHAHFDVLRLPHRRRGLLHRRERDPARRAGRCWKGCACWSSTPCGRSRTRPTSASTRRWR